MFTINRTLLVHDNRRMSGTWTYGRRLSSKTSIGSSARVRSFDMDERRASKSSYRIIMQSLSDGAQLAHSRYRHHILFGCVFVV